MLQEMELGLTFPSANNTDVLTFVADEWIGVMDTVLVADLVFICQILVIKESCTVTTLLGAVFTSDSKPELPLPFQAVSIGELHCEEELIDIQVSLAMIPEMSAAWGVDAFIPPFS